MYKQTQFKPLRKAKCKQRQRKIIQQMAHKNNKVFLSEIYFRAVEFIFIEPKLLLGKLKLALFCLILRFILREEKITKKHTAIVIQRQEHRKGDLIEQLCCLSHLHSTFSRIFRYKSIPLSSNRKIYQADFQIPL